MNEIAAKLSKVLHPLSGENLDLPIRGYQPPGSDSDFIPPRSAGVLLPIIKRRAGLVMLFTVRSLHLGSHPGEVSFPGGGIEECDCNLVDASIRETYEEVGIGPENITPVGLLDYFDTISGYRVLPVVALIQTPISLVLDQKEVAESFEVPLEFLLDRNNYELRLVERDGEQHRIHILQWQQHTIWGATASMLFDLLEKLDQ